MGYRADQKKVDRTNCSDRVNCEFRSNQSCALEIQQVGMADEGNYSCEVVTQEGNFHQMYQLTVLGKGLLPHFSLLQRTTSSPRQTQLLSSCTGGSVH